MTPNLQLSVSHLGYQPHSPKTVTLIGPASGDLPERIPFFIRQNCFRMKREVEQPLKGFSTRFPAPYELLSGRLQEPPDPATFYHRGELVRKETRWGVCWQADFSDFQTPGSYQIETEYQVSAPFMIADWIYDRLVRGYLTFLHAQRCGHEVPGVHPACHLDDGVLDIDGSHWPSTGGWHDAGDFRKWLALTQGNIESLIEIIEKGHPAFAAQARDEIQWGNRLFHKMITAEGQVFEDVAGGSAPKGLPFTYEEHWWFENHPGCYGDATDNRWTDNRPHSGDERMVRTTYNPVIQFGFAQLQAQCSHVLPGADGAHARSLAERAWKYGRKAGHDGRTLFIAQELLAALEIGRILPDLACANVLKPLVTELLTRQEHGEDGLSGFFFEKEFADAYRSITYAGLPAWALLRLIELAPPGLSAEITQSRKAVARYCDSYLKADAASNPFAVVPYGVFLKPEQAELQTFRDAGSGRGVRTFIHPFNRQGIAHGTSSTIMAKAAVLAKASRLLRRSDWKHLAEQQIQWTVGHNTLNRSLYNGIGYRQPVGYGFRVTQIPEATVAGFIGRPDDTPYLEESFAIEWNTLEYWDVPYAYAIQTILNLSDS